MLRPSCGIRAIKSPSLRPVRLATTKSHQTGEPSSEDAKSTDKSAEQNAIRTSRDQQSTKKTSAQMDEDMRRAMEGVAGDGGEAGLELEDGKAVSMKRGVRENMFRYI